MKPAASENGHNKYPVSKRHQWVGRWLEKGVSLCFFVVQPWQCMVDGNRGCMESARESLWWVPLPKPKSLPLKMGRNSKRNPGEMTQFDDIIFFRWVETRNHQLGSFHHMQKGHLRSQRIAKVAVFWIKKGDYMVLYPQLNTWSNPMNFFFGWENRMLKLSGEVRIADS